MKKSTLYMIAAALFVVLVALCLGIYYLFIHKDDIKEEEEKEETPIVEKQEALLYSSRNDLRLYDDYLVEINDDTVKIMDYKTNVLYENTFANVTYLNVYYGIDDTFYILSSENYNSEEKAKVSNFKLAKINENELEDVIDFTCEYFSFVYNEDGRTIGIAIDKNEMILYNGKYVSLNDYSLNSFDISALSDIISRSNEKLVLSKCLNNICNYALLDVETQKILPVTYQYIEALKDGNFKVKENNKYGIVSKDGTVVVEAKYDFIDSTNKEFLLVSENKKISIMDGNYKIVNKEAIDYSALDLQFNDTNCCGYVNSIHADYVNGKYLVEYNDVDKENADSKDDNKLYIINEDGSTEVKDEIVSYTYDENIGIIFITCKNSEGTEDIQEIWNKELMKIVDKKIVHNFLDMEIIIDKENQMEIRKNNEEVDTFYYNGDILITDEYFIYANSIKEVINYYYSV